MSADVLAMDQGPVTHCLIKIQAEKKSVLWSNQTLISSDNPQATS